jgi:hypothetical protein
MFVLLAAGVWIGMTLAIIGGLGMIWFTTLSTGVTAKNLFTAFWNANASWELAALPLFIWMGEILFRTRLSEQMFSGLAPWLNRIPDGSCTRQFWLRDLRVGVGLLRRDVRNDFQGGAARASEARVRRAHRARVARHRRHARHPDPAVDHDGGLCGRRRSLHHPHLPRRFMPASC